MNLGHQSKEISTPAYRRCRQRAGLSSVVLLHRKSTTPESAEKSDVKASEIVSGDGVEHGFSGYKQYV